MSKKQKITVSEDTPEPERYARIIMEQVQGHYQLMQGNFDTMKNNLGKELRFFKAETMEQFAKIDLRFMAQDHRFNMLDQKIENFRVELKQEIQDVRTELKQEIHGVRIELKQEIRQEVQSSEARLADKIDQLGERIVLVEEDVAKIPRSSLS